MGRACLTSTVRSALQAVLILRPALILRPGPTLPPPPGSLDVEEACRGFLDLAKEGAAACVAVVFSDPAFAELFQRLYSRWGGGWGGMGGE